MKDKKEKEIKKLMKKRILIYSIIWAICLGTFNTVVFVTPNEICGISKFDTSFWVAYIAITIAFLAQIICAIYVLNTKNFDKLFCNFAVLISYAFFITFFQNFRPPFLSSVFNFITRKKK